MITADTPWGRATLPDEYFILVDLPCGEAHFLPTETAVRDFVEGEPSLILSLCKLLHIDGETKNFTEYHLEEWLNDDVIKLYSAYVWRNDQWETLLYSGGKEAAESLARIYGIKYEHTRVIQAGKEHELENPNV